MNFYLINAFVKSYIQKRKDAQEKVYNEMAIVDRIFLILEKEGLDENSIQNYIDDVFAYDGYKSYVGMTDKEIIEDFWKWR
jgi:hypothetical protein